MENHEDEQLEEYDERYWSYRSNPVPWWLALLWLSYFIFAVSYLVIYMI